MTLVRRAVERRRACPFMRIRRIHPWDSLAPKQAVALQRTLANRVDCSTPLNEFELVAGADCSYTRFSPWVYAAIVVWRRRDNTITEVAEAVGQNSFPYIPGLLSFREGPILLEAFAKLKKRPHVILIDGQGLAHPRRLGVACHVGLFLNLPTIGCGKSRLLGTHGEPRPLRGSTTPLVDRGETIGAVLRTKDRCRPLYISAGHRIDLPSAIDVVLSCGRGYRQPEPTRLAHQKVNELRKRSVLKGAT